jgi:hypothetical protein
VVIVAIIVVRMSIGSRRCGSCRGRWRNRRKNRSSIEEGKYGVKVVRVHAIRANWETGGKAPLIFDPGLIWRSLLYNGYRVFPGGKSAGA